MKMFTRGLLLVAAAGAMGLTACQTGQAPRMTRENDPDRSVMDPNPNTPRRVTTAPAPGRTTSTGWPTMTATDDMGWSAIADPTGDPRTSVVGIEIGAPRQVRLNQPWDATIVITNLTDRVLSNVAVKDSFGSSYTMRSASLRGRQNADGSVTWLIENLQPRESKTIRLTGVATSLDDVQKCIGVLYDAVACTAVEVVNPALQITKSQTGGPEFTKCDEMVYTFRVTNSGTGHIGNVQVIDELPPGLTTLSGARTINLDVGRLAEGESRDLSATVKASEPGTYQNRARATGDGGVSAESNVISTTVTEPILTVTKNCPAQEFIGRPISYELTVRNTGDATARNVTLEDILPANATLLNASDGGRSAAGKVTWDLGSLAPGQARTVSMTVRGDAAGTLVNRVTANDSCADPVSDSCSTELRGIPAILLEVVDIEDPDLVGTTEDYQITVTNQGSAPATNIVIVCTLEPQHEYVSSGGPTTGTTRGPRTVEFAPLASLAPQAKATWIVTTRSVGPGDVRFKVEMTSDILTRPVEETEATRFYQ